MVAQKRDICCPQSASSPLAGTSVRRAGLNFRHSARGLSSRIAQPRPVSDGSDHNQSLLCWGALRSAVQSSDIGSRQKILQRIFCRRPKNRVQTRHNDPTMTPTASLDMQPTRGVASWAIGAAAIGRRTALRCRKGLEDPPAPLRHLRGIQAPLTADWLGLALQMAQQATAPYGSSKRPAYSSGRSSPSQSSPGSGSSSFARALAPRRRRFRAAVALGEP